MAHPKSPKPDAALVAAQQQEENILNQQAARRRANNKRLMAQRINILKRNLGGASVSPSDSLLG